MESLHKSEWDVVLAGTGVDVSLLALALSRSGKKILHVDKNGYYGGSAAALSLQDAEVWVEAVNGGNSVDERQYFKSASIEHPMSSPPEDSDKPNRTLGFSRAYSLALAPDVIYARSALLAALVSAKVDSQLEFLALGDWWLCNQDDETAGITKVPSAREDLFADRSITPKTKRALIKFLRFMTSYEEADGEESWRESKDVPFADFLQTRFGLSPEMQQPIHALAMSPLPIASTTTEFALKRVARHVRSIGVFGQGFGAVVPKWGGLAEITQVGCRGCAVGGGTYVLGRGVGKQTQVSPEETSEQRPLKSIRVELNGGDEVSTGWVVYGVDNVPPEINTTAEISEPLSRSISIVSSGLESLFPLALDGTPTPAGAVICMSLPDQQHTDPPITVVAHSSDTGECPSGQCILYASTALPADRGHPLLTGATALLLTRTDPTATVLWRLQYEQRCSPTLTQPLPHISTEKNTISFPPPSLDAVFDDTVLDRVRVAWRAIMGEEASDGDFLNFEPRGGDDAGSAEHAGDDDHREDEREGTAG